MQLKTRCIILKNLNYSDNSIIIHAYTREHGRMAFIVTVSRSKTGKLRRNLFQPFFLLDIEATIKDSRDLQRITEARIAIPYTSIPYDPFKNSMALFLSEVLYASLKEEFGSRDLFDFLENSIQYLDLNENNFNDFHIIFLSKLLRHLGLSPSNSTNENQYFDMQEGNFLTYSPSHPHFMSNEETRYFLNCLQNPFNNIPSLIKVRRRLLEKIIEYYKIHHINDRELKSLNIYQEMFS